MNRPDAPVASFRGHKLLVDLETVDLLNASAHALYWSS